jgi:aryl-alcohol dehydrogenase-like predicted oxidoreductase
MTLYSVAKEVNRTPNQVVLAWMLQSTPPVIPLIAASTEQQLIENIDSVDIKFDPEQLDRLNSAGP